MALKNYQFARSNEQLANLLQFAVSCFADDGVRAFGSHLDILYEYNGAQMDDGIVIEFLHGASKPNDFVAVIYFEMEPVNAGLYTYDEFATELYAQLMSLSESDANMREKAHKLIAKYDLNKYAAEPKAA